MSTDAAGPALERVELGGLTVFTDEALDARAGILVAFSARTGGASAPPWGSLDLAGHTGDDSAAVDENRRRLLGAVGLDASRLVTAEQVHGDHVVEVDEHDAGAGARIATGRAPVPGADGLLTTAPGVPLLMMYADCVPVVIVAEGGRRAVSVVHAGWRGALAGIPGLAAAKAAAAAGVRSDGLTAYVGSCVCASHYEVSEDLASAFHERYASSSRSVSILAAPPRVDLATAVMASLEEAGLTPERVATLGMCTVEEPALFYSYRAEGLTGRHGALAAIRA